MASYRGHLVLSSSLGFVYGGIGASVFGFDPATAVLGAVITAIGGMLPDLDSDSGVPVREGFALLAALVPLILLRRLACTTLSAEEILLACLGMYAFIKYAAAEIFKRLTVHRGMFHSIPAMGIAGCLVYLGYTHPNTNTRLFLAGGTMVGFFSHLLLDELCSVDFRGLKPRLNQYAGTALKFRSPSLLATATTYLLLLLCLAYTVRDYEAATGAVVMPVKAEVAWVPEPLPTPPPEASALPTPPPNELPADVWVQKPHGSPSGKPPIVRATAPESPLPAFQPHAQPKRKRLRDYLPEDIK